MDIFATGSISNIIAPSSKGIAPNISVEIMAAGQVLPAADLNTEDTSVVSMAVADTTVADMNVADMNVVETDAVVTDMADSNTAKAAGID